MRTRTLTLIAVVLALGVPMARPSAQSASSQETRLAPDTDTFVERRTPNTTSGGAPYLVVRRGVVSLIDFSTSSIETALANRVLKRARLEITLTRASTNPRRRHNQEIVVGRVERAWSSNATWLCADDTIPTNHRPDCRGNRWRMVGPNAPLDNDARRTIPSTVTSTTIVVDVTPMITWMLDGTSPNFGWFVSTTGRGAFEINSREAAISGVQLVLSAGPPIVEAPVFSGTFTMPPASLLTNPPLPPSPHGGFEVAATSSIGAIVVDPTAQTPRSAAGDCLALVLSCYDESTRNIAGCFSNVPTCATTTPWQEAPCCPASCGAQYQAERATRAPDEALLSTIFSSSSCIPGMSQYFQ